MINPFYIYAVILGFACLAVSILDKPFMMLVVIPVCVGIWGFIYLTGMVFEGQRVFIKFISYMIVSLFSLIALIGTGLNPTSLATVFALWLGVAVMHKAWLNHDADISATGMN